MGERVPSPEQLPNQPFHDLLREFEAEILEGVRDTLDQIGMVGYPSEVFRKYDQELDELLAERDAQRGGQ